MLRQATYGDITQSATVEQLKDLLATHSNSIPEVIKALMVLNYNRSLEEIIC